MGHWSWLLPLWVQEKWHPEVKDKNYFEQIIAVSGLIVTRKYCERTEN